MENKKISLSMWRNEADTRATLIEPKLKAVGWTDSQITREYYYQRDFQYTQGRIILEGNRIYRGKARKVDYLLRLSDGFPIAVVEAKAEGESAESGLEQAKRYAQDLGLAFAYSTNGHKIIEFDFFTNSSRELERFPSPEELKKRWFANLGTVEVSRIHEPSVDYNITNEANPLLYPYCPERLCGKVPYYFQEVAIREVIKRIMLGRKRILLTMATGTGKTFVAFQIVWKLIKSKWLQRQHPDNRPGRVLFLADRLILRDQAYNTFAPFADGTNEPRFKIENHEISFSKDLYFGIYQTLWSPDENGVHLFEKFPKDFFDLVIIDECHRSGWGTWRGILDHFFSAVHLGMTATPKRDENVDTYAYFCSEEPEIYIDPEHPELGKWRPPAYQYSLGQGIEDGFLATYEVKRVYTTIDKSGLRLQEAIEQGADVFIPEDVIPREIYTTPQFEREISLPDRTRAMVKHLAELLRRFGPMEKTMVFCVDMEHARLVARLLQDEFGPETGLPNYAVPIISEEGEEGRRNLEAFADSDRKAPVVATTAELLSTGVDVPSCRNIVFMKTVSSPILFKQIIGRGSRIDPTTEKYWFRIIDYTNATRLFDEEWDKPSSPLDETPTGPWTSSLEGIVFNMETGDSIVGARVSVRTGPNSQQGPIYTDNRGYFRFDRLPSGKLKVIVGARGFVERNIGIETLPDKTRFIKILLKPERKVKKIRVEGIEVTIAEEFDFFIEETGEHLNLERYIDYVRKRIYDFASGRKTLLKIWLDTRKRRNFLEDLKNSSINPEILAIILNQREADTFDLLCHIAFGSPIRTRSERVIAFKNREQAFILRHSEDARKVIFELLEKYRAGGIEQFEPEIFNVSPFSDWGGVIKIAHWFGGLENLSDSIKAIKEKIYEEVDT